MKKYYKGFNKDMTCRGFQFEEGKTYEEQEAHLCHKGFHACENPLDCWDYYNMMDSVFHEVTLDGVSAEREDKDTKVCAKKITIGARLDMKGIVKASVDFILESVKNCKDKRLSDNGGNSAQIGSSGYYAKIGSSGYSAKIGSSGYYAKIGSSGDSAKIDVTGERSVAACVGNNGRIKAKFGCWIVLSEWKFVGDKYTPVCVKSAKVDGETIKPDTWYKLENGEFVEVSE